MSSLQLGLIVAGVVLVVAVIAYNVWQERRLKRSLAETKRSAERSAVEASRRNTERVEPTLGAQRASAPPAAAEPAFRPPPARESTFEPPVDVIAPPASSETIDAGPPSAKAAATPHVDANEPVEEDEAVVTSTVSRGLPPGHDARKLPQPDHEIECLIPLSPAAPIAAGALAAGLHARLGKPLRWIGRIDARSDWQQIAADTPGRFADIVACMLLADRNGAASRAQLETFARIVRELASTLAATFTLPDLAHEATRAESLDRLCAELDVQIGLTVQMPEPASIPGTRLRGVAEAAGFRLSPAGRFEFVNEDTGAVLYTLQNLRPDAFSAEMLRLTATNGVVFLLDVARLSDPVRAFDQMKMAAKRMATTLGAELVDDNRRPLDDAALATIREQVQAAADALRAVHIEPGSQRALALFSA
jgi:FtsZ-interacting cell division protein ZipA